MKTIKSDSGSVLVFITVMIVLLLVMVGMGLDTGWLTSTRSQGQRAVDMAALAGAAGAAKGDVAGIKKNIENLANDYVKVGVNPIDGTVGGANVILVKYDKATGTITPQTDITLANGVRVSLEDTRPVAYGGATVNKSINAPLFLTPLFNLMGISTASSTDVNVTATATYSAIPGIPIALGGCTVSPDQAINLDQSPSNGDGTFQGNNSGWTTYTVKETNTPDIQERIRKIANCQGGALLEIGTPICLQNSPQPPVLQEFESLVDRTGNTCYIAPIIDPINVFNKCDMEIRGWAQICLQAVCAPGATKNQDLCEDYKKKTGKKGSIKVILANVKSCNATLTAQNVSQCYTTALVRDKNSGM